MAEKIHMKFLELNYNSIELSEKDRVATLVGSKDKANLPIVYFNQPLRSSVEVHLNVKKNETSDAQLGLLTVGCTSCDVKTIRSGFYHTFSLCRKDFMCQGTVKQLNVPKKVGAVTIKLAEDGVVSVKGYANKSSALLIFSGVMKPQSDRGTIFIVLSGSASQIRMEQSHHAINSLKPTNGLPWAVSQDLMMHGDLLSRIAAGKTYLATVTVPISESTRITFKITKLDRSRKGSFTLGLTRSDPLNCTSSLPSDSSQLHSSPWSESCLVCSNPLPIFNVGTNITVSRLKSGLTLQCSNTNIPIFDGAKLSNSNWYFFMYLTGAIDEVQFTSPERRDAARPEPMCAHCRNKPARFLFFPCGHFGVCESCNQQEKFADCIACKTKVMTLIKLLPIVNID